MIWGYHYFWKHPYGEICVKFPLESLSLDGCPRKVHTTHRQRVTGTRPVRQMCHLNPTIFQGVQGKRIKEEGYHVSNYITLHGSFHCFCWNWKYNLDCKVICRTSTNTSTCGFQHLVRLLKSASMPSDVQTQAASQNHSGEALQLLETKYQ